MDATTMHSTTVLLKKIKTDYPQFRFKNIGDYKWLDSENTVFYDTEDDRYLLHELAHAILGHTHYEYDLDLVKMERDAWEKAKKIAPKYNIEIDDNFVQDNLDQYRSWLHSRSTCTTCGSTGAQTDSKTYLCPVCNTKWRVNDARRCELRRYLVK